MSVALRTGMEGTYWLSDRNRSKTIDLANEKGHDAKKDTGLRNFTRLRLDVCQKQLDNFHDSIDEYKRNGMFAFLFFKSS